MLPFNSSEIDKVIGLFLIVISISFMLLNESIISVNHLEMIYID